MLLLKWYHVESAIHISIIQKSLYMCYVPDSTDTQLPAIGSQFLTLYICIQIIQWLNSWSKLFSKLINQMWSDVYFFSLIKFTFFFLEIYNINVKYINCFFIFQYSTWYQIQQSNIDLHVILFVLCNQHAYIYICHTLIYAFSFTHCYVHFKIYYLCATECIKYWLLFSLSCNILVCIVSYQKESFHIHDWIYINVQSLLFQ
jgi:hypothetical protein